MTRDRRVADIVRVSRFRQRALAIANFFPTFDHLPRSNTDRVRFGADAETSTRYACATLDFLRRLRIKNAVELYA
jgi:hypothetical protein